MAVQQAVVSELPLAYDIRHHHRRPHLLTTAPLQMLVAHCGSAWTPFEATLVARLHLLELGHWLREVREVRDHHLGFQAL